MPRYNDDFPIAFQVFAGSLRGSDDEVWTQILRQSYGDRKLSELGWRDLLATVKAS